MRFQLLQQAQRRLVTSVASSSSSRGSRLLMMGSVSHHHQQQQQQKQQPYQMRASLLSTSSLLAYNPLPPVPENPLTKWTGGQYVEALAYQLPRMDVVTYEHKNRTWSLEHVQYYSEALAIGFLELGFQSGDVILSWLPQHFSEQMVLQFACSKAGFVLYSLDPMIAVVPEDATDEEIGVAAERAMLSLKKALELTKANVLISPEAWSDVNYVALANKVIPELRIFNTGAGLPFVSPRFPHLRLCVQTGFDQIQKFGWFRYKHMMVPSNNLDHYIDSHELGASTPLAGTIKTDANGVPTELGPTLTNEQIIKDKVWPTYTAILHKEYHEVKGIGNIF